MDAAALKRQAHGHIHFLHGIRNRAKHRQKHSFVRNHYCGIQRVPYHSGQQFGLSGSRRNGNNINLWCRCHFFKLPVHGEFGHIRIHEEGGFVSLVLNHAAAVIPAERGQACVAKAPHYQTLALVKSVQAYEDKAAAAGKFIHHDICGRTLFEGSCHAAVNHAVVSKALCRQQLIVLFIQWQQNIPQAQEPFFIR